MKIIYKYPLQFGEINELEIPKGSRLVLAGIQSTHPMLWFEVIVSNAENVEKREFVIYPTGAAFDKDKKHIASFQDDPFVWHVLETVK